MNTTTTLEQIAVGSSARVQALHTTGSIRRRLLDLGMIPGTRVECLQKSPAGDPTAYLIRGAVIALRCEDSATIQVM
ncbi:MAG: ferrous iron transport protein A [Intestinibacillus sp.]